MSKFISLHDDHGAFNEALLRSVVIANALYACNGDAGRVETDPVFKAITEGRQTFDAYSSCGDLIHWSLRRAGLRDEKILNRSDDDGKIPWQVAVNISRLVYSTGNNFTHWKSGTAFDGQPGDMGMIGDGGEAHVFIIAEVSGNQVTSYDYGQFFAGKHGGKKVVRSIVPQAGRLELIAGGISRPWIGHLNISSLLKPYFDANTIVPAEVEDDFPIDPSLVNPY